MKASPEQLDAMRRALAERHRQRPDAASAFDLARLAYLAGDYDEALQRFVEAHSRAPGDPGVAVALVRAASALGLHEAERAALAAGLRAASAGNVGTPVLDLVQDPQPYDVIAVELSSFQLHWSHSLRPRAAACLNIAPDHIDWHGSLEEYAAAKGKVYANTEIACVYNEQDPATRRLVEEADVVEGCRAVSFTLGSPGPSMLGLVEDVLADRAFVEDRATTAAELGSLADLQGEAPSVAPHLVANALAAAALARAHGVPPVAVRDGLRAWQPCLLYTSPSPRD